MRRIYFVILLLISNYQNPIFSQHKFEVNLNERSEDLFHVALYPQNLTEENKIYNFAATAPGTYQLMNIGRYVRSFYAFDIKGNVISATKISQNRWSISHPEKVFKIDYTIAETWDTPVEKNPIYYMAGSSIEEDNVVMNNQCIFGYFEGMQNYPINIKIEYPNDWKVGTAMKQNSDGYYMAESFDYLVDSPILLGDISEATVNIEGTEIKIFTYSKTDLIKSQDLLESIKDIIYAADKFTNGLPVDEYSFLFHFEDEGAGAWEHSYSSFYVYPEYPLSTNYIKSIRSTVAHEFFHIVTPLNIHSELITNFNFAEPKLSQHIWFYEGVTEWASDAMQLRNNISNISDHLSELTSKLNESDNFRKDLSLTELSVNSFELQDQFYLFYCRGSIVMTLLDIKLLYESGGQKGLRELINELADDYGANKSFSEENFFNEIAGRTFPDINDFFESYVKSTLPLPLAEYFNYIGINYYEVGEIDSSKIGFDFGFAFSGGKLSVASVSDTSLPIQVGDIFLKYNSEEITSKNIGAIYSGINRKKPGAVVNFTLARNSEEINFDYKLQPLRMSHLFELNNNASEQQLLLRQAWMRNN